MHLASGRSGLLVQDWPAALEHAIACPTTQHPATHTPATAGEGRSQRSVAFCTPPLSGVRCRPLVLMGLPSTCCNIAAEPDPPGAGNSRTAAAGAGAGSNEWAAAAAGLHQPGHAGGSGGVAGRSTGGPDTPNTSKRAQLSLRAHRLEHLLPLLLPSFERARPPAHPLQAWPPRSASAA